MPEKGCYGMSTLEEKIEAYIKAYQKPPYGREVEGTVELLEECKDAIRMCTMHRWIPVEERMPENGELVLISAERTHYRSPYKRTFRMINVNYCEYGYWSIEYIANVKVVAWMPLPEPYRSAKEDADDGT